MQQGPDIWWKLQFFATCQILNYAFHISISPLIDPFSHHSSKNRQGVASVSSTVQFLPPLFFLTTSIHKHAIIDHTSPPINNQSHFFLRFLCFRRPRIPDCISGKMEASLYPKAFVYDLIYISNYQYMLTHTPTEIRNKKQAAIWNKSLCFPNIRQYFFCVWIVVSCICVSIQCCPTKRLRFFELLLFSDASLHTMSINVWLRQRFCWSLLIFRQWAKVQLLDVPRIAPQTRWLPRKWTIVPHVNVGAKHLKKKSKHSHTHTHTHMGRKHNFLASWIIG